MFTAFDDVRDFYSTHVRQGLLLSSVCTKVQNVYIFSPKGGGVLLMLKSLKNGLTFLGNRDI